MDATANTRRVYTELASHCTVLGFQFSKNKENRMKWILLNDTSAGAIHPAPINTPRTHMAMNINAHTQRHVY